MNKLRAQLVICQVAHRHGVSTSQCRAEMMAAIEAAWSTTDPQVKQSQIELVGEDRIPTPEELITLIFYETT
jgi:hypothetical protein